MNLDTHVVALQDQLTAAARLGDDRTRETARALAEALDPAVRLTLLRAVSAAVEEIDAQLEDASASARLDGRDLYLEVQHALALSEPPVDDGEATARISLRLSEGLKAQVENAARQELISVNTWLVRAAAAALAAPTQSPRGTRNAHRTTGWIHG